MLRSSAPSSVGSGGAAVTSTEIVGFITAVVLIFFLMAGLLDCTSSASVHVPATADHPKKLTTESLTQHASTLDEGDSDGLTSLLTTMARFHRYSWLC
jgi:hypothetical protein